MATPADRDALIPSLQHTLDNLDLAFETGRRHASQYNTIFLVGSGSGQHVMRTIKDFIRKTSPNLEFFSVFSSRFPAAANDPKMNSNALAFVVSKSGNTRTTEVAKLVQSKAGRTIVFTQHSTNAIASYGDDVFSVGDTKETLLGLSMLMYAVTGGLLAGKDHWPYVDQLSNSLRALPKAYARQYELNME